MKSMSKRTERERNRHRSDGTVKDVVCPECFRPCEWPKVQPSVTDRYGRTTRIYYAWCFRCCEGFIVDQFERDDRWAIRAYRKYRLQNKVPVLTGDWVVLNDLPEPAPVVLGPGGDFDRHIELRNTKSPGGPLGKALAFLKKTIGPKEAAG